MKSSERPPAMGRPREFDADEALDQALRVFWEKGYEGASMADLTEAMGINRPSLYAAFGNKESLFRQALHRYVAGPASYVVAALEAPTARQVAERLLDGAVGLMGDPKNPGGCFATQNSLACGDQAAVVKRELIAMREEMLRAIRERFERAKAEGELAAEVDAGQLARYLATVIQGLSVQSASGAAEEDLRSVAMQAMKAWPD